MLIKTSVPNKNSTLAPGYWRILNIDPTATKMPPTAPLRLLNRALPERNEKFRNAIMAINSIERSKKTLPTNINALPPGQRMVRKANALRVKNEAKNPEEYRSFFMVIWVL